MKQFLRITELLPLATFCSFSVGLCYALGLFYRIGLAFFTLLNWEDFIKLSVIAFIPSFVSFFLYYLIVKGFVIKDNPRRPMFLFICCACAFLYCPLFLGIRAAKDLSNPALPLKYSVITLDGIIQVQAVRAISRGVIYFKNGKPVFVPNEQIKMITKL